MPLPSVAIGGMGLVLFIGLIAALNGCGSASQRNGQITLAEDTSVTSQARYTEQGVDVCLRCHRSEAVTAILQTPHAQQADPRTPFAAHGCESCHGPGSEHLKSPRKETIPIRFGPHSTTPVAEQNQVCLNCHEVGGRMNWRGSPHQFADIACTACHQVHTVQDKVQVKTVQPRVCYRCHAPQRAQVRRFSHHPIEEGKVVCADCHNVHGSFGPKLLLKATVNETCYLCHPEIRGPFLWEHAPVREDCGHCHEPHGTTQPRLLKVRTPWLCQQCHMEAFHPSVLYSGTGVPPQGVEDRILLKGCLNCHAQVHGSNHPSGIRLMR
jgi:DmsE family decaheme c-type cytochrome